MGLEGATTVGGRGACPVYLQFVATSRAILWTLRCLDVTRNGGERRSSLVFHIRDSQATFCVFSMLKPKLLKLV